MIDVIMLYDIVIVLFYDTVIVFLFRGIFNEAHIFPSAVALV